MGSELHITRAIGGDDGDGGEEIAEDEWLQFVTDATDFEFQNEVSTTTPSGDHVVVGGSFGCWTGHATVESVPFRWSHGAVHVALADNHAVVGALRVADALSATVVDDEGQHYTEPLGNEPAWEFPDDPEPRPDPVPIAADQDGAAPRIENVPFDFDGDDTFLERLLPWFRRQRRR